MSKLPTNIAEKTAKFHIGKAHDLQNEYYKIESIGKRKILEAENQLKSRLENLQKQIDGHKQQAANLSKQS